jgi:hypothetical protein
VELEGSDEGVQASAESAVDAWRPREKLTEAPDRVAVMEAEPSAEMEEVLAEKLAEVEPGWTVTEAGTVSAALLSARVTAAPPAGAALLRVTVQVAVELEGSDEGVQASAESAVDAWRPREKLTEAPDRAAVMEAEPSVEMEEVLAEKLAEVEPVVTLTEAGTVSAELLSDRDTTAPPAGAALLSVTVQVAEELGPREAGEQAREVGTVGAERLSE